MHIHTAKARMQHSVVLRTNKSQFILSYTYIKSMLYTIQYHSMTYMYMTLYTSPLTHIYPQLTVLDLWINKNIDTLAHK